MVEFVLNLVALSLEFDPTQCNLDTNLTHLLRWLYDLDLRWLYDLDLVLILHLPSHPKRASEMVGKFKLTFFSIPIYEFNIYLYFKKMER